MFIINSSSVVFQTGWPFWCIVVALSSGLHLFSIYIYDVFVRIRLYVLRKGFKHRIL